MSERDTLAAEYALGVLEGEALLEARSLEGSDPAFAEAVAAWTRRLEPLFDGFAPTDAPPDIWDRVQRAIRADDPQAAILQLRRRVGRWRTGAGIATAIAAALALVVAFDATRPPELAPTPAPAPPVAAPVLTASIDAEDGALGLAALYRDGELIVTPARLPPVAQRDYELWVIGESGTPRSLGVLRGTAPQRLPVPEGVTGDLRASSTLAVSIEPAGGSPTGAPTGPVVASGILGQV